MSQELGRDRNGDRAEPELQPGGRSSPGSDMSPKGKAPALAHPLTKPATPSLRGLLRAGSQPHPCVSHLAEDCGQSAGTLPARLSPARQATSGEPRSAAA